MLNSFAEESHECVDECLVVRGAKTCRRCATNGKQLDFGNPRHGPRACHILVGDTMIGVVIGRFALADASRFVKGELPADSYLSDSVEIGAHMRELFRIASSQSRLRQAVPKIIDKQHIRTIANASAAETHHAE